MKTLPTTYNNAIPLTTQRCHPTNNPLPLKISRLQQYTMTWHVIIGITTYLQCVLVDCYDPPLYIQLCTKICVTAYLLCLELLGSGPVATIALFSQQYSEIIPPRLYC